MRETAPLAMYLEVRRPLLVVPPQRLEGTPRMTPTRYFYAQVEHVRSRRPNQYPSSAGTFAQDQHLSNTRSPQTTTFLLEAELMNTLLPDRSVRPPPCSYSIPVTRGQHIAVTRSRQCACEAARVHMDVPRLWAVGRVRDTS
jgi:hypothetical protein